jgi:NADH-quinone oxidoreductase subunit K
LLLIALVGALHLGRETKPEQPRSYHDRSFHPCNDIVGYFIFHGSILCVSRRNLIMILLGIEIMLNAASIAFVGASLHFHLMEGQVFALFIIAAAAAEVSVGLALFVCLYRRTGSLDPGIGE